MIPFANADDYISEIRLETSESNVTFITEINNVYLGGIHVRALKYSMAIENCETIPLLAVSPKSQGLGIGKRLIDRGEKWAKN